MLCVESVTWFMNVKSVLKNGTIEQPKSCWHRNLDFGRVCNEQLLRRVVLKESEVLYLIKVYCYAHLKTHLQSLFRRLMLMLSLEENSQQ